MCRSSDWVLMTTVNLIAYLLLKLSSLSKRNFAMTISQRVLDLRVIHVLEWPGIGGVERVVLSLAAHDRENLQGFIFFRNGPGIATFKQLGKPILIVEDLVEFEIEQAHAKLEEFITSADILHLHSMYCTSPEIVFAKGLPKPFLVTLHSGTVLENRDFPLVCVSKEIADSQHPGRFPFVVENGIDYERFSITIPTENTNKVILIRVCRPERSAPAFWNVMNRVLADNSNAELWLVGESGNDTDRIRYLGMRQDIPFLLSKADIFVYIPSHQYLGAHDLNVLEAMASGLPVVTTNLRGVRQSVSHLETGIMLEPSDENGLVAWLGRLIQDSALRRQFGQVGRKQVEERFSLGRMADQYQAIYRFICDEWTSDDLFALRSVRSRTN
jgi:glycosyltransferase involved in cell wall biosynthesis